MAVPPIPPITLTALNSWGRERTLSLRIAADGSATFHSPADGTLRITAEEMRRFAEKLDLHLSAQDFPGGFQEMTPRVLIEPLEPVNLDDIGPLDPQRKHALRECDAWINALYDQRRMDENREQVAISLGEVRRWLYREAPTPFWIECVYAPAGTILSHALAHLPPPVDTKNPSP